MQAVSGGTGTAPTGAHRTDPCGSPSTAQLTRCGWRCDPPPCTHGTPVSSVCSPNPCVDNLVNKLHHKTRIRESFLIAPLQHGHQNVAVLNHRRKSSSIFLLFILFYSHLQLFSFATMGTMHTRHPPFSILGLKSKVYT